MTHEAIDKLVDKLLVWVRIYDGDIKAVKDDAISPVMFKQALQAEIQKQVTLGKKEIIQSIRDEMGAIPIMNVGGVNDTLIPKDSVTTLLDGKLKELGEKV